MLTLKFRHWGTLAFRQWEQLAALGYRRPNDNKAPKAIENKTVTAMGALCFSSVPKRRQSIRKSKGHPCPAIMVWVLNIVLANVNKVKMFS